MKIIIQNQEFNYDLGCALLKAKYKDTPFQGLEDIWDDIVPATFKQIIADATISNVEQRRVALNCIGTENFLKEVNAELLDTDSIDKTTTWINSDGVLETKEFVDTYELHKVPAESWTSGVDSKRRSGDVDLYFIKFKDTSTDREYILWIEPRSVASINDHWIGWNDSFEDLVKSKKISAIDCVAWTIQTTVPKGMIKEIIRQGDCILVKPTEEYKHIVDNGQFMASVPPVWRSITGKEYRQYLLAES